jgi:transposase
MLAHAIPEGKTPGVSRQDTGWWHPFTLSRAPATTCCQRRSSSSISSSRPTRVKRGIVGKEAGLLVRWIVERTIAWLNRCRRLAKDWENLNRKGLAFLRLASIRLMLRKLCNPP